MTLSSCKAINSVTTSSISIVASLVVVVVLLLLLLLEEDEELDEDDAVLVWQLARLNVKSKKPADKIFFMFFSSLKKIMF